MNDKSTTATGRTTANSLGPNGLGPTGTGGEVTAPAAQHLVSTQSPAPSPTREREVPAEPSAAIGPSQAPTGAGSRAVVAPDPIFQIASGFMAAKHLFVVNEVGLFEELAEGPATLDELVRRSGVPRRTLRILADAMVATYLPGGMV